MSEEKKQDLNQLLDALESLDEKDLSIMMGGAMALKARKALDAEQPG